MKELKDLKVYNVFLDGITKYLKFYYIFLMKKIKDLK